MGTKKRLKTSGTSKFNKLQKVFDHFKYRHFHPGSTSPSGSELIAEVEILVQNHHLLPNSKLFYCKRAPTVMSKKHIIVRCQVIFIIDVYCKITLVVSGKCQQLMETVTSLMAKEAS